MQSTPITSHTAPLRTPDESENPVSPSAASDLPSCPMAPLLTLLTRPWTMHILWNLSTRGPMRFGALRRQITGISPRLLTLRLRELEAEGFVRRSAIGGKVPQVTYSPTQRMADMDKVMAHLEQVNQKWQAESTSAKVDAQGS